MTDVGFLQTKDVDLMFGHKVHELFSLKQFNEAIHVPSGDAKFTASAEARALMAREILGGRGGAAFIKNTMSAKPSCA